MSRRKPERKRKLKIVVDFEMCNVPASKRAGGFPKREIIQIGAVKVGDNFSVEGEFSTYVRPDRGALDKEISRLTGISQADLADSPNLVEALAQFAEWARGFGEVLSWGGSDRSQLASEVEAKRIANPEVRRALAQWGDLRAKFASFAPDAETSLENAMLALGVERVGRAHDGLSDARAAASVAEEIVKRTSSRKEER